MKKIPLLFVVLLLLSACSEEVPEAELIGVYVASYRGDLATLSLKADHSYTHVIRLKDGQKLEAEATWKASQVASGSTKSTVVEVSNFRAVPSFTEARKSGWASEVDRTWLGQLRLCFDTDAGYCYVKRASS